MLIIMNSLHNNMFKYIQKIKQKIAANKNHEKGVALVIAINLVTLLLSISFSISNIVLKQIQITNINNASKPAFFVADSAAECAFFHDTRKMEDAEGNNINADFGQAIFGTTTAEYAISQIVCGNGAPINLQKDTSNPTTVITTFDVDYGTMCANVKVVRTEVKGEITARGYNTTATASGCDLSDIDTRRLVERGLTITY